MVVPLQRTCVPLLVKVHCVAALQPRLPPVPLARLAAAALLGLAPAAGGLEQHSPAAPDGEAHRGDVVIEAARVQSAACVCVSRGVSCCSLLAARYEVAGGAGGGLLGAGGGGESQTAECRVCESRRVLLLVTRYSLLVAGRGVANGDLVAESCDNGSLTAGIRASPG